MSQASNTPEKHTVGQTAEYTIGRDEMRVYDALVKADCALTSDDLAAVTGRPVVDVIWSVVVLVADGLCWRDGALVGLVQDDSPIGWSSAG